MSAPALIPLFQNDHWVAVDKPAGLLSVPSRLGADDPRPVVGRLLETQLGTRIYPVHRLDQEVSGILLFALSAEAHKAGNGWFERHEAKKTYEALTASQVEPPASPWVGAAREAYPGFGVPSILNWKLDLARDLERWTSRIERGKRRSFFARHGNEAATEARARAVEGHEALRWELRPLTGRPHQLRVELAVRLYPILGDALYGSTRAWRRDAIALRAIALDLSVVPNDRRFGLPDRLVVEGLEFSSNPA